MREIFILFRSSFVYFHSISFTIISITSFATLLTFILLVWLFFTPLTIYTQSKRPYSLTYNLLPPQHTHMRAKPPKRKGRNKNRNIAKCFIKICSYEARCFISPRKLNRSWKSASRFVLSLIYLCLPQPTKKISKETYSDSLFVGLQMLKKRRLQQLWYKDPRASHDVILEVAWFQIIHGDFWIDHV